MFFYQDYHYKYNVAPALTKVNFNAREVTQIISFIPGVQETDSALFFSLRKHLTETENCISDLETAKRSDEDQHESFEGWKYSPDELMDIRHCRLKHVVDYHLTYHSAEQAIFYCPSSDDAAYMLDQLFVFTRIPAAAIYCNDPSETTANEAAYEKFKRGEIKLLFIAGYYNRPDSEPAYRAGYVYDTHFHISGEGFEAPIPLLRCPNIDGQTVHFFTHADDGEYEYHGPAVPNHLRPVVDKFLGVAA